MSFYPKKAPKREEQKKTMISFHTRSMYPPEHWRLGYLNIVSIDPGIVNLGLRVERRYDNGYVQTIGMQRECFSEKSIEDGDYSSLYTDVINWLDRYQDYFKQAHIIIFERQLHINYQTTRLCQHIITYMLILLRNSSIQPLIAEIDSKAKYKVLGAPKGYNDTAIKQWGVEHALEILRSRGEHDVVEFITSTRGVRGQKKHDDLCDVVLLIEAFFRLYNSSLK